jgi:hypothetical protein
MKVETMALIMGKVCLILLLKMTATKHFTIEPTEDMLVAALQQYAKERLTADQRIMQLEKELSYRIRYVKVLIICALLEHISADTQN